MIIVKGDATNPQGKGVKIVAHIVNDLGKFGKGFALAVAKKWPKVRQAYMEWSRTKEFCLGEVQLVNVNNWLYVANMVAQHGLRGGRVPPIRYDALEKCLTRLALTAEELNASVHCPRIGCGLAGGDWKLVEPLLRKTIPDVTVYVTN